MNWLAINVVDVFFTGDAIILFAYDCKKMVNLWCILVGSETVSRLRVYFHRNSSCHLDNEDIIQLLCILCCPYCFFLTSLVGLPLVAKFKEIYLGI